MIDSNKKSFTGYEKWVILILAFTQFTVILDFMIMSPLGDTIMKSLSLSTRQFGLCVSAYAFSAGISGLLTAGFADKFDRKKILLFFYSGFIIGTFFCAWSTTYPQLLAARIVTGLFGGVIGSISMAIVTDIFTLHQRGRVIGFVQMGFGASQVLGLPIGLAMANRWGWDSPFLMAACLATVILALIIFILKPVNAHLANPQTKSPFKHLLHTFSVKQYRIGFLTTSLMSIGGFMMMPFGSAFAINNLHITNLQLPIIYTVSGLTSLAIMPIIGKLSDRIDKFKLFAFATVWMIIFIVPYTNLGVTPLWIVLIFNIGTMIGIMSRMVPSTTLVSAIPEAADRGAFMSINSSLQQIAGGVAAAIGGLIISQKTKQSPLVNYNIVGHLTLIVSLANIFMLREVNKNIKSKFVTKAPESELPKSVILE